MRRIIGVDCATVESKIGIALGTFGDGDLTICEVRTGGTERPVDASLKRWIEDAEGSVLLAFDAPLGWPTSLGSTLAEHRAGMPVAVESNVLFRRATDRFIHDNLGKKPLDVGADRIARTAHAALQLLEALRRKLSEPIPLAWSPTNRARVTAIEVYPAATLIAHGFRSTGYKKPTERAARQEIITSMRTVAQVRGGQAEMEGSADALDAAVCLVAAADFLSGRALSPPDQLLAEREGWIWVSARSAEAGRAKQLPES